MTIAEAKEIIKKTKSQKLKRDMERFIRNKKRKERKRCLSFLNCEGDYGKNGTSPQRDRSKNF